MPPASMWSTLMVAAWALPTPCPAPVTTGTRRSKFNTFHHFLVVSLGLLIPKRGLNDGMTPRGPDNGQPGQHDFVRPGQLNALRSAQGG